MSTLICDCNKTMPLDPRALGAPTSSPSPVVAREAPNRPPRVASNGARLPVARQVARAVS